MRPNSFSAFQDRYLEVLFLSNTTEEALFRFRSDPILEPYLGKYPIEPGMLAVAMKTFQRHAQRAELPLLGFYSGENHEDTKQDVSDSRSFHK
jgi:hypothetical protein